MAVSQTPSIRAQVHPKDAFYHLHSILFTLTAADAAEKAAALLSFPMILHSYLSFTVQNKTMVRYELVQRQLFGVKCSKTKELTIDFRWDKDAVIERSIYGEKVETVGSCKYLGMAFDNTGNTEAIVKPGQQTVRLLWKLKLKYFNIFFFTCWFDGSSLKDRNSLNNIVKI